jgi:ABC-type multidrug transport system fused ATPase/permease subunit
MRPRPLLTVLDEPAASLDAATESAIFERYAEIARAAREQGSITLFVSHRFSTVRSADLIVMLDKGRIIESGDHDGLIAADGEYARLYRLQARAYLDGKGKPSPTAEPGG